tara:strand:+ start:444 stop:770 length:327 start_codon:yes stop_codon:yes gene_type:complete
MIQISDLDRRIDLQSPTRSANSYGEQTITYTAYRTVWAKVDWEGGGMNEESEKLTGTSKVTFYIRNLDLLHLTTETRILFDTKYYYIHVINEIEGRKKFVEILTEEKH